MTFQPGVRVRLLRTMIYAHDNRLHTAETGALGDITHRSTWWGFVYVRFDGAPRPVMVAEESLKQVSPLEELAHAANMNQEEETNERPSGRR